MEDALGDAGGFLSDKFAGVFVEGDEGGGVRGWDIGVGPVDAVGGGGEEHVAVDHG